MPRQSSHNNGSALCYSATRATLSWRYCTPSCCRRPNPRRPPLGRLCSSSAATARERLLGNGRTEPYGKHSPRGLHADRAPSGRVWRGQEPFRETLLLFGQTDTIAGYHGAGFVNAVFTPRAAKMIEITTYIDDRTREIWRSNREVITGWNPLLAWHVHAVPKARVLEANKVRKARVAKLPPTRRAWKDVMENLHCPLADSDVDRIVELVVRQPRSPGPGSASGANRVLALAAQGPWIDAANHTAEDASAILL